jgi:hypothetical protein
MSGHPKVAPYESCTACFKGDTTTAVQLEGEAEWQIAALMHWAGLAQDEAAATFLVCAEYTLGCEPGLVPSGRFACGFRLCRDCAARTTVEVTELGEAGPVYAQP